VPRHLLPNAVHHSVASSNVRSYTSKAIRKEGTPAAGADKLIYTLDNKSVQPSAFFSHSPSVQTSYSKSEKAPRELVFTSASSGRSGAVMDLPPGFKERMIGKCTEDSIEYVETQLPFWRRELWHIAANIDKSDPLLQHNIEVTQEMLTWWVTEFVRCRDLGLPRFGVDDATESEESSVDLQISLPGDVQEVSMPAKEDIKVEEDPFRQARLVLQRLKRKYFFTKSQRWFNHSTRVRHVEDVFVGRTTNSSRTAIHCRRELYFLAKEISSQEVARKAHLRVLRVSPEMLTEAVEDFKAKRRRLLAIRRWNVNQAKTSTSSTLPIERELASPQSQSVQEVGMDKALGERQYMVNVEQKEIATEDEPAVATAKEDLASSFNIFKSPFQSRVGNKHPGSKNTLLGGKKQESAQKVFSGAKFTLSNSSLRTERREDTYKNRKAMFHSAASTLITRTISHTEAKTGTRLTHLNDSSEAHMVNVGGKNSTHRVAVAVGGVRFENALTHQLIASAQIKKGDVLSVARVAGIMAAKNCPTIVPLCHPIALTGVEVELHVVAPHHSNEDDCGSIEIEARVECYGPTGVEMEALTAVAGASLTVIDMIKAVDRGASISTSKVVLKRGGRSGEWVDSIWERQRKLLGK
jgi:molybdenum cofactor biosynthesis protein MoaC